jgi:hypothetical protein
MAGGGIGVGTAIDNIAATLRKDEIVQIRTLQGKHGDTDEISVLNSTDRNTPKIKASITTKAIGMSKDSPITDLSKAPIGTAFWGDPSSIRYSQRTISENDYADLMRTGKWDWDINNPLVLLRRDGGEVVSIDNRRLTASQTVGEKSIPLKIHNPNDKFLDYNTWRTVEDAFLMRARDPRTIAAGGEIPSVGLVQMPIVKPKPVK